MGGSSSFKPFGRPDEYFECIPYAFVLWDDIEWRWKEIFVPNTPINEEGSLISETDAVKQEMLHCFDILPTFKYGGWDFFDFVQVVI